MGRLTNFNNMMLMGRGISFYNMIMSRVINFNNRMLIGRVINDVDQHRQLSSLLILFENGSEGLTCYLLSTSNCVSTLKVVDS